MCSYLVFKTFMTNCKGKLSGSDTLWLTNADMRDSKSFLQEWVILFFLNVQAAHMNMPLQNSTIAPYVANLNFYACGPIKRYYLAEWDIGCLCWFLVCDIISDFHSCLLAIDNIISPFIASGSCSSNSYIKKCSISWVTFKFIHIEFQDFSFLWTRAMLNGTPEPLIGFPNHIRFF